MIPQEYPYSKAMYTAATVTMNAVKARSSLDTFTLRSQKTASSSHLESPPTDLLNFHQIISNFHPPIRSSHLYRRYKVRLTKRKDQKRNHVSSNPHASGERRVLTRRSVARVRWRMRSIL